MRLDDYLRFTESVTDGRLDNVRQETRHLIAQMLLSAALRATAGRDQGARLDLGRVTVSTAPSVCWTAVDQDRPDDGRTVLLALAGGEVEPGYRDGEIWCYPNGETVGRPVTHWVDLPMAPAQ